MHTKATILCDKCRKDVFLDPGDYYMLRDRLWKELCRKGGVDPDETILCKACAETLLGRRLVPADLNSAPVNEEAADSELWRE